MRKIIFQLVALILFSTVLCHADETLTIAEIQFQVRLAITTEEQATGLMRVDSLEDNQGLLFVYPGPQMHSFWMKDTLIPLDILFFDTNGHLLEIIKNIPPCKASPCATYENQQPAQYVLELAAGTSEKHKFKAGDTFTIGAR